MDEIADKFDSNIEECLNEVAPYKLFNVKSHYKFGISESTKKLMEQRDKTRADVSNTRGSHKSVLVTKYKKLRNLCNSPREGVIIECPLK